MKRNLVIGVSALFIFTLFQMSSLKLTSNSAQPPQTGLAGDPGQTTCNNCHLGSTRFDDTKFTIRLSPDSAGLALPGSIVTSSTEYIPDSLQWVSIELNGSNGPNTLYGFQLTALDSANNRAGTFTLTNTTKTSQLSNNGTGRKYVGHKSADHTTKAWSFRWRAPQSGRVTFYYAGNIANGDGFEYTPGDSVYASSVTITAGPFATGISDVSSVIAAASAYPMPFSNSLHTDFTISQSAPVAIALISMEGVTVRELYDGEASSGKFSRSFELGDIAAGAYFVRIQSGTSSRVIKIIKL
ncbi:MAG: Reeler region domain protein [Bacteroidetes bacterium]|nr:Reeler region domain protein [Bacteroidota bacterium]